MWWAAGVGRGRGDAREVARSKAGGGGRDAGRAWGGLDIRIHKSRCAYPVDSEAYSIL